MSLVGFRMVRVGLLAMLASGSVLVMTAHANGEESFSLHRFSFTTVAAVVGEDLRIEYRWRVTVCTPRRARLRIRATVDSLDFGSESHRFVRRQAAGCTRHRLHADSTIFAEGSVDSMLRVAWKNQRRHTRWVIGDDPAPD